MFQHFSDLQNQLVITELPDDLETHRVNIRYLNIAFPLARDGTGTIYRN
jgi:hypothetical protein